MATFGYTYREYHFHCDVCGLHTVGMNVEETGGHGWDTAQKRNSARRRHEKECKG